MERELWISLYRLALMLDTFGRRGRYRTAHIVGVYLWAVLHDRSVTWACRRGNWPVDQPFPYWLPRQSTMSRRLRTTACEELLTAMGESFVFLHATANLLIIDAKPLPVGGYSKASDANWGRGAGCFQKGYKFYAVWGAGPMPIAWCVASMNVSEKRVGRWLMESLPGEGFVLGDTAYDTNPMHHAAGENGYRLLVPACRGKAVGHVRQSPHRLRHRNLMTTRYCRSLFRQRPQIEREFGNLVTFGDGLAALPAWVRTMPRVRPWIQAKLLVNAQRQRRLALQKPPATA